MNEPVVHAPELPHDFVWLNTSRPLSLRELRGHVVVLDFWTYCCVNCMHVLPILDALEERHQNDPLVVIGVHSAKFDGERDPERIADAIDRYGIRHPVIVDRDMQIWSSFAVRSWPTLVVVRPDGTLAAVAPGEPDPAVLERFVSEEIERARKRGTLAASPIRVERLPAREERVLSHPGKIHVARDGRIAVSDSGHHRVLVLDPDGQVIFTIGTGAAGLQEGAFDACELHDPQGVCFDPDGRVLYVADARNHVVFRADLEARELRVLAGAGGLGDAPLEGEQPARAVRLRSPWDVALSPGRREGEAGDRLYVALAGSHQIAVVDLARGTLAHVAGTGAESMVDGPFEQATFSQPSGLALAGHELWVADSETSSLRVLDLHRRLVRTVVGVGLFDFGDVDGTPDLARMQHCLGVALEGARVPIVADTYNHKLKRIDPATGETRTFFSGTKGLILREPGGVAWDPRRKAFLVADTGHGRIVVVSEDGGAAEVLEVRGAPAPVVRGPRVAAELRAPARATSWFTAVLSEAAPLGVGEASIELALRPEGGLHFAHGSRVRVSIEVSRRSDLLVPTSSVVQQDVGHEDAPTLTLSLPVRVVALPSSKVASEMLLTIDSITCSEGGGATPAMCVPLTSHVRLPITLAHDGGHHVRFDVPIGDPG